MAKDTAKKNLKSNARRINVFTIITLAVNAIYAGAILYRNGGLPGISDLVAIAFWGAQQLFALNALKKLAEPTLGPSGELLDCIDISDPQQLGIYTFAQDALWVCWVVQALCVVHSAFIVFYLPVPATLLYKIWNSVLKPLLAASGGGGGSSDGQGAGGTSGGANLTRQERRRQEQQNRKNRSK